MKRLLLRCHESQQESIENKVGLITWLQSCYPGIIYHEMVLLKFWSMQQKIGIILYEYNEYMGYGGDGGDGGRGSL